MIECKLSRRVCMEYLPFYVTLSTQSYVRKISHNIVYFIIEIYSVLTCTNNPYFKKNVYVLWFHVLTRCRNNVCTFKERYVLRTIGVNFKKGKTKGF